MSELRIFHSIAEITDCVGESLGPSEPLTITKEMIDTFALATNDNQAIHLDPDAAIKAGFRAPIAHGYLLLSLLSQFAYQLYEVRGTGPIINYGLDKTRFITPVETGDTVFVTAKITQTTDKQNMLLVHVEYQMTNDEDQLVMVAAAITGVTRAAG